MRTKVYSMKLAFKIRLFFVIWLGLFAVKGFCAHAEHVIIVSLDGARPDVVLTSNMLNVREMAREGSYTWWAQTVLPSSTLQAHCSMLSGCLPEKHGITWNSFKPDAGFVKTSTCFEIARMENLSTAMFVSKQKLEHIAKPGTVDKFITVTKDVAKTAGEYFIENKPNLLFVHFLAPDASGHAYGWGSMEQKASIEACDRGIGILRDYVQKSGVSANTVWIITADHGGHLKGHGSPDVRDMTIPWICYGPGIIRAAEIGLSVSICDTAATSVFMLGLQPDAQWDGKILNEIFIVEESQEKAASEIPAVPAK